VNYLLAVTLSFQQRKYMAVFSSFLPCVPYDDQVPLVAIQYPPVYSTSNPLPPPPPGSLCPLFPLCLPPPRLQGEKGVCCDLPNLFPFQKKSLRSKLKEQLACRLSQVCRWPLVYIILQRNFGLWIITYLYRRAVSWLLVVFPRPKNLL
jgi:hypothetical protein